MRGDVQARVVRLKRLVEVERVGEEIEIKEWCR